MKQEHQFVAQLFRYLAPFMDEKENLFISLDGMAAKAAAGKGVLRDADVPDLCLTLLDGRSIAIEAKILHGDRVWLGKRQEAAWRPGGRGLHQPTGWAMADEHLTRFGYWTHEAFAPQFADQIAKRDVQGLLPPRGHAAFDNIATLALHVLR